MRRFIALLTIVAIPAGAISARAGSPQDIFEAVRAKDVAALKALIEKDPRLVNIKDASGQAPLHWACLDIDMDVLGLLIEKGADLNAPGIRGRTPLHYALSKNDVEACRLLLEKGADPNLKDAGGKTPLEYAADWGFESLSELLLDYGGGYDASGDRALRLIQVSAAGGLTCLFKDVLAKVDEEAFMDAAANEILMRRALEGGSKEIVAMLLARNIPLPRDADSCGWTPFHYAADEGNLDILALLAEKGLDIRARTRDGESAYNIALRRGRREAADLIVELGGSVEPQRFPRLQGPYLGQKPPGEVPQIFALDILVKPKQAHSNIAFSADGTEAYWCYNGIYYSRIENGFWTTPRLVPFSSEEFDDDSPFVSPDGRKLFFSSKRPLGPADRSRKENYWAVDILADGWSEPKPLPPAVNALTLHWQITADLKGNVYFGYQSPDNVENQRDIYVSELADGAFWKPRMAGGKVNSEHFDINPFIGPSGDYLIFARRNNKNRPDGSQDIGLFISYFLDDGTWSAPIDLRKHIPFPTAANANCPIVSRDGKYLFFLDFYERNYQRYWLSAAFIENLRPKSGR